MNQNETLGFVVNSLQTKMHPSWQKVLNSEFSKPYMQELQLFLQKQKQEGKTIYPVESEIFTAFSVTPFTNVKVVLVGQDPYHGPDQAHGLSFSVKKGLKLPPSLKNIYKELATDLELPIPQHGYLQSWAEQGVLLLNSVLTVEQAQANSHQGKGWEKLTDEVIHRVNEELESVVFLLWGSYAQKKAAFVDRQKHLVIESVHPSPLSAHRGFFGTRPFSQINQYLISKGKAPIDWNIQ